MVRLRLCLNVRPDTVVIVTDPEHRLPKAASHRNRRCYQRANCRVRTEVDAPTIYFLGGLLDVLGFTAGLFPGVVLLSRRR